MTTALEEACTDLAAWLPVVSELTAEPDVTGYTETRGAPGSAPPWNPAVANIMYETLEAIRRLEQDMISDITHRYIRPSRPHAQTGAILKSIVRLSHAVPDDTYAQALTQIDRALTGILRLPGVDLEDICRKPDAPCPRCNRKMLRYWEREFALTGKLGCIGCQRAAILTIGTLSGEPILTWDDGEVTIAPGELEGAL